MSHEFTLSNNMQYLLDKLETLDAETLVVLAFLSLSLVNTSWSLFTADCSTRRQHILSTTYRHYSMHCFTFLVVKLGGVNGIAAVLVAGVCVRFVPLLIKPGLLTVHCSIFALRVSLRLASYFYYVITLSLRLASYFVATVYGCVRYSMGCTTIDERMAFTGDSCIGETVRDIAREQVRSGRIGNCAEDYELYGEGSFPTAHHSRYSPNTVGVEEDDESTWPGLYYGRGYEANNYVDLSIPTCRMYEELVDDRCYDYELRDVSYTTDDSLGCVTNRSRGIDESSSVHELAHDNGCASYDEFTEDHIYDTDYENAEANDRSSDEDINREIDNSVQETGREEPLREYIPNHACLDPITKHEFNRREACGSSDDQDSGTEEVGNTSDRCSSLYNAFHHESLVNLQRTLETIQDKLNKHSFKQKVVKVDRGGIGQTTEQRGGVNNHNSSNTQSNLNGCNKGKYGLDSHRPNASDGSEYTDSSITKLEKYTNEISSKQTDLEQSPPIGRSSPTHRSASKHLHVKAEPNEPTAELNLKLTPNNSLRGGFRCKRSLGQSLSCQKEAERVIDSNLNLSFNSRIGFLPNSLLSRPRICQGLNSLY